MTWNRKEAAAGIAQVLSVADAAVSVFATPPETFNPPAYIVGYPRLVQYSRDVFGIDTATLPVMVGVSPNEVDTGDALLVVAKDALEADLTLDHAVQGLRVLEQSNWRRLNVAGAEVLAVDLVVEITM